MKLDDIMTALITGGIVALIKTNDKWFTITALCFCCWYIVDSFQLVLVSLNMLDKQMDVRRWYLVVGFFTQVYFFYYLLKPAFKNALFKLTSWLIITLCGFYLSVDIVIPLAKQSLQFYWTIPNVIFNLLCITMLLFNESKKNKWEWRNLL